jgi:hypothetical protein
MTETYTVFAKRASDGGISYFHGGPNRECPCDLGGAVAFVASFRSCYSDSYEPFAWIGGSRADHAADSEVLAANSIAAGRTIEQIDGRYVPRGVPVEAPATIVTKSGNTHRLKRSCGCDDCARHFGVPVEDKPAKIAGRFTIDGGYTWLPIEQLSGTTPQPTKERTSPALTWADPAPDFDPWKGFFTEPADMADWQDAYYPR